MRLILVSPQGQVLATQAMSFAPDELEPRVIDGFAIPAIASQTTARMRDSLEAMIPQFPGKGHKVREVAEPDYEAMVSAWNAKQGATVDELKAEQQRRLTKTDWMIARAADPTDGRPIPEAIFKERRTIRDRAGALEAMTPIPHDITDDRHWV